MAGNCDVVVGQNEEPRLLKPSRRIAAASIAVAVEIHLDARLKAFSSHEIHAVTLVNYHLQAVLTRNLPPSPLFISTIPVYDNMRLHAPPEPGRRVWHRR
jgi:hypothetical protein